MAVSSTNPTPAPKTPHLADPTLHPFLHPTFDAAAYLNTFLPSLSLSSSTRDNTRAVPLTELSSHLQTLLSNLNAQTSRLSATLTHLTDDLLRTGSRLSYEVELLRGETANLTDALDDGLKTDIQSLAPPPREAPSKNSNGSTTTTTAAAASDPAFLPRLQTLTTVRAQLDTVIRTFGAAMSWPLAPSELSLTSSLIAVSAPETDNDEAKAKSYTAELRAEILALLDGGDEEGAAKRVGEFRQLAGVWEGTAEARGRARTVEGLRALVEERARAAGRAAVGKAGPASSARGGELRSGGGTDAPQGTTGDGAGSGYGFLQNLRNLKGEVYID